ncbi:Uncharacterized protein APZ42_000288, partial [Daphnia magna]
LNLKFPTNKSDPSNHLIVDLSETEAQRPQPIITVLDEYSIVDIEIDCDDISLWNRIDEILLSCVQLDSDFDQLDKEEENCFIHTCTSTLRGAFITTCDQGRSNRNLFDAMDKAFSVIASVRRSANDTEIIYKATKLHLLAKNVTRWNSQYYYLIKGFLRILEIDPLIQTKLNAPKEKSNQPFQEATDDLQADYETLGNVIPAYLDLLNKVSLSSEEEDEIIINNPKCPLAGKIFHCAYLADALKKISEISNVICAVLDPRFKKCWIAATSMSEHALLNSVSKKKRNFYSTINTPKRTPSAGSAKILDELEVYLSEPNIPIEELDDSGVLQPTRALKYWKLHSHRFLFLSLVARDIYGCPTSYTSIERAFPR